MQPITKHEYLVVLKAKHMCKRNMEAEKQAAMPFLGNLLSHWNTTSDFTFGILASGVSVCWGFQCK
jgi:hypothetical protein